MYKRQPHIHNFTFFWSSLTVRSHCPEWLDACIQQLSELCKRRSAQPGSKFWNTDSKFYVSFVELNDKIPQHAWVINQTSGSIRVLNEYNSANWTYTDQSERKSNAEWKDHEQEMFVKFQSRGNTGHHTPPSTNAGDVLNIQNLCALNYDRASDGENSDDNTPIEPLSNQGSLRVRIGPLSTTPTLYEVIFRPTDGDMLSWARVVPLSLIHI